MDCTFSSRELSQQRKRNEGRERRSKTEWAKNLFSQTAVGPPGRLGGCAIANLSLIGFQPPQTRIVSDGRDLSPGEGTFSGLTWTQQYAMVVHRFVRLVLRSGIAGQIPPRRRWTCSAASPIRHPARGQRRRGREFAVAARSRRPIFLDRRSSNRGQIPATSPMLIDTRVMG